MNTKEIKKIITRVYVAYQIDYVHYKLQGKNQDARFHCGGCCAIQWLWSDIFNDEKMKITIKNLREEIRMRTPLEIGSVFHTEVFNKFEEWTPMVEVVDDKK